MKIQKKFTLFELLIVISILAILVSLLMPSLRGAREHTKFAICISQKSQNHKLIMLGLKDNDGKLPLFFYSGNRNAQGDWYKNNNYQPDYEIDDWMGTIGRFSISPTAKGKRYAIINPVAGLYAGFTDWIYNGPEWQNMKLHPISNILRCPSLEEGEYNTGIGSNGAFDYSFTQALRGFHLSQISTSSTWHGNDRPTPLVMEEDPASNINNNGYLETSWANGDTIGTWHNFGKKGSYTALDGSNSVIRSGPAYTANDNPTTLIKGKTKSLINCNSTEAKSISGLKLEPDNKYSPKITRF